jgi:hypothetical protein
MRGLSQNVTFAGGQPDEAGDEPPGRGLAVQLAEALRRGGATISEPALWRDSGWSLGAEVAGVKEEIVVALAPVGTKAWFVQIAPAEAPGALRRIFGPSEHPSAAITAEVAWSIHRALSSDGRFSGFRWRWDGPSKEDDPAEPSNRPAG